LFSVKEELLKKSREAALAAVQIFNNPNVTFKSETYVMLMIIAWTYLLHAYYRGQRIDYRYFTQGQQRKRYDRTKHGAYKRWELERCLNDSACPLDRQVVQNLKFLIGLQMTTRIDDLLSARFQACCINYHEAILSLFGERYGIARHLAVSLQFASLVDEQVETLDQQPGLPGHIKRFIAGFDGMLAPDDFASPRFAYRVIFVPKTVNHPSQADQVIKFVKADSELAQQVNATYAVVMETEKPKWLPSEIVRLMNDEGFPRFGMHQHTQLWKGRNAKAEGKGFGVAIGTAWYWYAVWLEEVRQHCRANRRLYQ
jgi:hypothetical protein